LYSSGNRCWWHVWRWSGKMASITSMGRRSWWWWTAHARHRWRDMPLGWGTAAHHTHTSNGWWWHVRILNAQASQINTWRQPEPTIVNRMLRFLLQLKWQQILTYRIDSRHVIWRLIGGILRHNRC
jgi:hypothetical protein